MGRFGPLMSALHILGLKQAQELGCSPREAVRELDREHHETVRSLAVVGVGVVHRASHG